MWPPVELPALCLASKSIGRPTCNCSISDVRLDRATPTTTTLVANLSSLRCNKCKCCIIDRTNQFELFWPPAMSFTRLALIYSSCNPLGSKRPRQVAGNRWCRRPQLASKLASQPAAPATSYRFAKLSRFVYCVVSGLTSQLCVR